MCDVMTVRIEAEIRGQMGYVADDVGKGLVSRIELCNEGDGLDDLVLRIDSDIRFFEPVELRIDRLAGGSRMDVSHGHPFEFDLLPEFFRGLKENVHSDIRMVLFSGTDTVAESVHGVEILAESDATAPGSAGYPASVGVWKRGLLDLSTRNCLLRMKTGKKLLPLIIPDIGLLEELLLGGGRFVLAPKPSEWDGARRYRKDPFETERYIGSCDESLSEDIRNGILHSPLGDKDAESVLRSLSRASMQDLEESGYNSLFLYLGSLKWSDPRSKNTVNHAPLLLIPVGIGRTAEGYAIEVLDEGPFFNATLGEKLEREHGVTLPVPDSLLGDIDVNAESVMRLVEQAVRGLPSWEVVRSAGIGIFSFSQYAIWKDLGCNIGAYMGNPIVRSLAAGTPYGAEEPEFDPDPCRSCLVVPADGSQTRAVNASADHSFVMHGPPGTGKSQTIANIIAQAMMDGRKVLFVAEKRAALEAVKKRLDEAGVGEHCLELHSDKTTRAHVVSQLRRAFEAPSGCDGGSERSEAELREEKRRLDGYAETLHRPMIAGLSMYDLISRFDEHDVSGIPDIRFQGPVGSFTEEMIADIGSAVDSSAVISERVKDLDESQISFIGTDDIGLMLEEETEGCIEGLRSAAESWKRSLDRASSLDMVFPPLDFEGAKEFYGSAMQLDAGLVRDPSSPSYPDRISGLNASLSWIASELRRCGALWNNVPPEDLRRLRERVDRVGREYGCFIDRGYCTEDASVRALLDSATTFCDGLTSLRADLSVIGAVWNRDVFSRPDAKDLYSAYRDSAERGRKEKREMHDVFIGRYSSAMRDPSVDISVYGDTAKAIPELLQPVGDIIRLSNSTFPCRPLFPDVRDAFVSAVADVRSKLSRLSALWCRADPVELNRLKALATKTRSVFQHLVSEGYLTGCESTGRLFDSAVAYCDGMLGMRDDLMIVDRLWRRSVFLRPDAGDLYRRYRAADDAGPLRKGRARKDFMDSVSSEVYDRSRRYEEFEESLKLIREHASSAGRLLRISKSREDRIPEFSESDFPFDVRVRELIAGFRRCGGLWCKASVEDLDELKGRASALESEYRYLTGIGYVTDDQSFGNLFRSVEAYCSGLNALRDDLEPIDRLWTRAIFTHPQASAIRQSYERAIIDGNQAEQDAQRLFVNRVSQSVRYPNMPFGLYEGSLKVMERVADRAGELYAIVETGHPFDPVLTDVRDSCIAIQAFSDRTGLSGEELAGCCEGSAERYGAVSELERRYGEWMSAFRSLCDLLKLETSIPDVGSIYSASIGLCEGLDAVSGRVRDIATWHRQERQLIGCGLSELVPFVIRGEDRQVLADTAYRAFYRACLEHCLESIDGAEAFRGMTFDDSIGAFRECENRRMELNRDILRRRLHRNLPIDGCDVPGTEAYALMKAIQSTSIRKSVRALLSEFPHALLEACPCLLMSPLSVSQYLGEGFDGLFDLAIFDESSQMATAKAVCALGRARNAVIAGDDKQLPPTAFFRERDGTDGDRSVSGSLLDDCIALGMPEIHLERHYRSRYGSLIAFSNRTFYGNGLLTNASADDGGARVSAIRVVDGIYEKGSGRNVPEARAVAEEVRRRVMDPNESTKSIGVVAFSVKQQACIRDMLDDLMVRDREFSDRFDAMPEGVFVKNLETVQGDERDVILFSIGYGRSPDGQVHQNFGPLNRADGWKRLNVAASRARCEMVVFESVGHENIGCAPDSGKGAKALREFMRFAENDGRFEDQEDDIVSDVSPMLRMISAELHIRGYGCRFSVGSPPSRVDLAVVDPENPEGYILGILSDEGSQGSDNARDREFARADALMGLGWDLIHVWSAEWRLDRNNVIRKVLRRVGELGRGETPDDGVGTS